MFRSRLFTAAFALALSAPFAIAGPLTDYEASLRQAYGAYRAALFQTNSANAAASAQALAQFREKWSTLSRQPAPPQYADDAGYAQMMARVLDISNAASAEIASGKLSEAHETLEEIRDRIGHLRERNGIVGFSDRMNVYHARMEEVLKLELSIPDIAGRLREEAAVLAYLAGELTRLPPPDADQAEFPALMKNVTASVSKLQDAARSGDPAALKAAVSGLKQPYARLFLKFG